MIRALIFDFDGLILETEEASYKSWVEVYESFGFSLPFSTWSIIVGTTRGDFDPRMELQRLVKAEVDWKTVEARRQESENALIEAQPVLPGVEAYLRDARQMGLKLGLASNSSCRWVIKHLTRLGLEDFFDCICAADDVKRLKPDPESYQSVLRGLEVSPTEVIAFEDSPIGIRAAKAAGLVCVAVPNVLTRQLDLTQADFYLNSLTDMTLEELLPQVNAVKTQRAAL